jgi:hypothetical protein
MSNPNINPAIIAAGIARAGIGSAVGFMTKGEELERQGAGFGRQLGGSLAGGFKTGLIGTGIGIGVGGTGVALRKILGK